MSALLMASRLLQPMVDAPVWALLLLKGTAILLAAWLAHLALARTNPRWRVVLWRVTAVGLMALPAAAWFFPALQIRVEQPPPGKEAAAVPTASRVLAADRDVAPVARGGLSDILSGKPAPRQLPIRPTEPSDEVVSTLLPQPQAYTAAPLKPSLITLPTMLLAAWLGGIGVLAFRLCIGHYRIWRMARRAEQPPQWVRSECLRVAQAIGCRGRVEVLQSAAVQSPLLFGVRRPLLLLPIEMCDDSYRDDLPGIFAHELTHVRSNDVRWNVGLHLISIALWFHPFAWRVRKAHLAACELVSDAVSAGFVGDVTEYCRTLARVAVHAYTSVPANAIAMARLSSISRRLSALKRRVFSLPLRRRSVIGFGFAALVAVAVLGVLQFAFAAPPAVEPAAAAQKAEAKPAEKEAEPTKNADATPKAGSLRVRVLDPQGNPLSDVKIHASTVTEEKDFKWNRDYKTDAAGTAQVELPKTYSIVRLWASKKPFVEKFAHWEENDIASGQGPPEEYTFRLEPGVSIGGRILDEETLTGLNLPAQGQDVHLIADRPDLLQALLCHVLDWGRLHRI